MTSKNKNKLKQLTININKNTLLLMRKRRLAKKQYSQFMYTDPVAYALSQRTHCAIFRANNTTYNISSNNWCRSVTVTTPGWSKYNAALTKWVKNECPVTEVNKLVNTLTFK